MKILFACNIADPEARQRIEPLGEIIEAPEADSPEKLLAAAEGAEMIIVPYTAQMLVTQAVIDALPQLKLIGSTYGGVRQNIDELYALEKGICVIHTGPTRIRPMAEYTLGLALSALTQISNYHHYMRSGEAWPRANFGRTRILHNRKVGVIGFGWIGQGIAELFKNFTPNIQIHSQHASEADLQAAGYQKAVSLESVFAECEVIILAGGYNPQTHHMIRAQHFEAMAEEALFINIARGKMVHQAEMIEVAERKNIYLALDVFENEPLEDDSPLRKNDRYLIAPHRANAPREFEERWKYVADELERFTAGQSPETALSPERAKVMSES
ncbi:MAG: glyoxylate reductase [Puniceicoccaceae bacterium]|nr:glyoxylate reductase [Puniceicoccaceae bacterium]|tara:strand:- start:11819 stop:12802 length:984 start_codon:yes stop_codon:yes gene_type:complete